MVLINKSSLPADVDEKIIKIIKSDSWKKISENDTESIRNVFDNEFPKADVKKRLIEEQHGICSYCMKRIYRDSHSEVEHFVPLSEDKDHALDYRNLLATCDGGGLRNQKVRKAPDFVVGQKRVNVVF